MHYSIFAGIALFFLPAFAAMSQESMQTVIFKRMNEPRENAFSILVPQGWNIQGGIFRVDPSAGGGPANAIEAKLDFAMQDKSGIRKIHWLPAMRFFDARMSPAGQMGLFPPGSNYMGMTVSPIMSATDFLTNVLFPHSHPNAAGFSILDLSALPELAQKYQQRIHAMIPQMTFSYDAGRSVWQYEEDGVLIKEAAFVVIENYGSLGAGMWGNKDAFYLRTQVNEFEKWQPVFSIIQQSVKLNPQWIMGEIKGQAIRSQIMIDTQRETQRLENEMLEHQRRTTAEIHNDIFLMLTDQEEYVNPFTNEIEIGSNQWNHRWANQNGDIIYTNNPDYDPNVDINLNLAGFKKTQVRKRFPQ